MSFLIVCLKSFNGFNRQIIPNIIHMLNKFVPIILPKRKSAVLLKEAVIDKSNSGKLVPAHTIVNPIIISLNF